jgi:acetate kinase
VPILTVNAGSTSVKVTLIDAAAGPAGQPGDASAAGPPRTLAEYDTLDAALDAGLAPDAVGHRVVHGGARTGPELITDQVLAELRALTDLAPLQQPPALDAMDRCRRAFPGVPQVACFDTAFHATLPPAATTYALPARYREKVRVYGFHGLSYAWSASRLAQLAPGARRAVVAHLGGGASLCGMVDGASAITTMGFTPTDGLVMATRSGSVDPGAVTWLAARTGEDVGAALERESGLQGLCGTGDMREVLDRAGAGDPAAGLALQVYLHRLIEKIGGCVAVIGGLDALVFTGGVGEHDAPLRQHVADRLSWLGVRIDPGADGEEITGAGGTVRVFDIHAREDLQIAREAARLLSRDQASGAILSP